MLIVVSPWALSLHAGAADLDELKNASRSPTKRRGSHALDPTGPDATALVPRICRRSGALAYAQGLAPWLAAESDRG